MGEIKWEDTTGYSKRELASEEKDPRSTVLKLDGFTLRVHRDFKRPWLLTCSEFHIFKQHLRSKELERAQEEAIHTFREKTLLHVLGEVDRAIEAFGYAQEESSA